MVRTKPTCAQVHAIPLKMSREITAKATSSRSTSQTRGRLHTRTRGRTANEPVATGPKRETEKLPFDIQVVLNRIRDAVRPFRKAALFELYEEDGFRSLFEQLVACIISIRTRDETTVVAARRLFQYARTPAEIAALSPFEIDSLIHDSTFHEAKAKQIHEIARRTESEFGGELPCDLETLLSFHGVGIKCAHLALGIACAQRFIAVDIHVHRVTNRWGYVSTSSPERTTNALATILPHDYWIEINSLLVPFGKHICTGVRPKCSTCPVLIYCQQVGVTSHR